MTSISTSFTFNSTTASSISTYNDLFVENLILNGVEFNVENFKGEDGEQPTVDPDDTENQGDPGANWTLNYQTVTLTEANVPLYYLPDPAEEGYEFTAIQVKKISTTTLPISIFTHNHELVAIMYPAFTQTLHMIRSPTN